MMLSNHYLYNKRAGPQTMLKILCLHRQGCQIKSIKGLPKTWGVKEIEGDREKERERERERERAEIKI
jgi:hypothetical protein